MELRQHHDEQGQVLPETGSSYHGASIIHPLAAAAAPSSAVFSQAPGILPGQSSQLEDLMGDADLLDMIGSLGGTGNMFPFDEVNFWAEDM
jgi:hypothetical protein